VSEFRVSGKYYRRKRTEWRLQKRYALRTSLTLFCAHGVALSNAGVFKITKAAGSLIAPALSDLLPLVYVVSEWHPEDPAPL
jgi:hypothetical protein